MQAEWMDESRGKGAAVLLGAGGSPVDSACLDAAGADLDFPNVPVHQETGALKVGHEAPYALARDVAADAPFFLRLSFAGEGVARGRFLPADRTDFCHGEHDTE